MRISPLEAFNTALDMVAFMVLIILFVSARNQSRYKVQKSDDILMMATMFLAVSTLADAGTWAFLSESADSAVFNLCIIVDYEFMQVTLAVMHIYVARYLAQYIALPKWFEYIAIPVCILMGVLWSLSIRMGIFYDITPAGYQHTSLYVVSQVLPGIVILIDILLLEINFSKLPRRHAAIWICYGTFIIASWIIEFFANVPALYVALALVILIIFLDLDLQKNTIIQQHRADLAEANAAIVLAQIKPHFIYNCLATIHELCRVDSSQAAETTKHFSDFLRGMMNSIEQKSMVTFNEEMNIVNNYLYIEKVRFGEKIQVVRDIEVYDFDIPPLTIQPLVENAVKHGLRGKPKGGTISIHSYTTMNEYVVAISDDGIGFEADSIDMDQENHIGLKNVEMRLRHMCGGYLEVQSTLGAGTSMILHIPKNC